MKIEEFEEQAMKDLHTAIVVKGYRLIRESFGSADHRCGCLLSLLLVAKDPQAEEKDFDKKVYSRMREFYGLRKRQCVDLMCGWDSSYLRGEKWGDLGYKLLEYSRGLQKR